MFVLGQWVQKTKERSNNITKTAERAFCTISYLRGDVMCQINAGTCEVTAAPPSTLRLRLHTRAWANCLFGSRLVNKAKQHCIHIRKKTNSCIATKTTQSSEHTDTSLAAFSVWETKRKNAASNVNSASVLSEEKVNKLINMFSHMHIQLLVQFRRSVASQLKIKLLQSALAVNSPVSRLLSSRTHFFCH